MIAPPLLVFFGLLVVGLPIYLVLGLTSLVAFGIDGTPLMSLAQKMVDEFNSGTLMAVPFFVMSAAFMQKGGVASALVNFAMALIGGIRGGLGVVCVLACTIFAAVCGSSVATALAMVAVLLPAMQARNYGEKFSLGVIGASGTLGILIPPSLPLILFGILSEESIPRLFLAGIVPGLVQAAIFAVWVMYYARRNKYPVEPRRDGKAIRAMLLQGLPALSVPAVIAVGLYGGLVTVTEAAALAAVVALVASLAFYKGFRLAEVPAIVGEALKSAASIMIIIVVALAFGHWVTQSGAPTKIVALVLHHQLTAWQFLLAVNLLLLVLGMFLEVASIMLITLPILLPILAPLGINPVHFAIVIVINMEIALITPPVGLNLFVLSSAARVPVSTVVSGIVPFIVLLLALLAVVTYVPAISLWLPNLVYR